MRQYSTEEAMMRLAKVRKPLGIEVESVVNALCHEFDVRCR